MKHFVTTAVALLLVSCGSQDKAGNQSGAAKADGSAGSGSGSASTAAANFQPGQWEVTANVTRLDIQNAPPGVNVPMPPPTTINFCMTPEQAARPDANALTANTPDSGCSYQDFTMANGRIQGTVQCAQSGATMRTALTGQFTATTYDITQQARITVGGIATDMEARTTARRTGDCPAG